MRFTWRLLYRVPVILISMVAQMGFDFCAGWNGQHLFGLPIMYFWSPANVDLPHINNLNNIRYYFGNETSFIDYCQLIRGST